MADRHNRVSMQKGAPPSRPIVTKASWMDDKVTREKRVMLSHAEEEKLVELLGRMIKKADTTMSLSQVLRACVYLLLTSGEEVLESIEVAEPLVRPGNGDREAMADFECQLAGIFVKAFLQRYGKGA